MFKKSVAEKVLVKKGITISFYKNNDLRKDWSARRGVGTKCIKDVKQPENWGIFQKIKKFL